MSNLLEPVLPSDPIAAIRYLTESEHKLDLLRLNLVKRARLDGRSWEEIAVALGISRQSAWQFYAPRILKELEQEENCPQGLSGEEASDLAVSESRAVRRRRRTKPV